MSNSPEQYLDFFNFPESDSSLNFRGYNGYAEDESLFQNIQCPQFQEENKNKNVLGAETLQEEAPEGFKFPPLFSINQEAAQEQNELDFVKEQQFGNFDNFQENYVFSCSQQSKKIEKSTKQEHSKLKSLACRNIKCNFAASLENFIEFIMHRNLLQSKISEKKAKLVELKNFIHAEQKSLRGFQGWKDLWLNPRLGMLARKISYQFFSKSFAETYIQFARIKEEYKDLYQQSIVTFINGIENPTLFTSFSNIEF